MYVVLEVISRAFGRTGVDPTRAPGAPAVSPQPDPGAVLSLLSGTEWCPQGQDFKGLPLGESVVGALIHLKSKIGRLTLRRPGQLKGRGKRPQQPSYRFRERAREIGVTLGALMVGALIMEFLLRRIPALQRLSQQPVAGGSTIRRISRGV